jgi:hypothetical protein
MYGAVSHDLQAIEPMMKRRVTFLSDTGHVIDDVIDKNPNEA